jgi:cell division protein FtsW (lipid II flippase)
VRRSSASGVSVGIAVVVVSVGALLALSINPDGMGPDQPPPPVTRATLGALWLLVQIVWLVGAYVLRPGVFGLACGVFTGAGLSAMAAGRWGLTAPLGVVFAIVGPVLLLALAFSTWLRGVRPSPAYRVWCIFGLLAFSATVYLFSAGRGEAVAHLRALAGSLALCGVAAVCRGPLVSLAGVTLRAAPRRLSMVAWGLAVAFLAFNAFVVRAMNQHTPQLAAGPLSFAPYFLSAWLVLLAVALDVESWRGGSRGAMVRSLVGLAVCAGLYIGPLKEHGTLVMLAMSTVALLLFVGTPLIATAAAGSLLATQAVLQAPPVVALVQTHSVRAGERLLAWSGEAAPPDQITRVMELLGFAGLLGHMGAAKVQFLIGSQASRDYVPALIVAQGGWFGLAFVLFASTLFVAELYLVGRRVKAPVSRALVAAVVALLVGNLLATMMWLTGLSPFVGIPVPLLARAGSHLFVLVAALLIVDVFSQADALNQRRVGKAWHT